ncbi:MAG: Tyrosine-tRNA ligase [candidate division WS6 bacterium GW2011_GWD1_35_594]|nr:MAG: tyrosyl-tRNA synthetase, tyrosyl-tRNA synthetase [candidate division WS6 bacterium GW2011_GWF1_33_233]KKP54925.1 MAG: tyrosyl-tRNA synthetase, tyrosyl-tRNA synthetase [candidate division WS6 bacterium GW2011_WS6_33_547]KKP56752.1 MAG: Tyrosine-tRNA ligase [candidate division WS6 bacterium GW2011_GWF2_33_92]KKP82117.1 MAG: Tyrosine-tRNA ligase [candidate division WS6 bacterium GW2011_GWD1_35_594]HBB64926.1 tyrosine--tRNA ligase [Patescibacteria group bacterium]
MDVLKDEKIINRILTKGVEQILPSPDALRTLLMSGKRINVYQGFDPTAPTLHIGHTVGMRKLEDFRKLGHQVSFVIGDFTARIGDPSDKTSSRVKLTKEQVESNMKTYVDQASHILDIFNKENPVKIVYNGKWLEPLTFGDIIELASLFTVQQMLKRSMFQKRLEEDKPIYLNEFLYPLMQGYDSVMMDIDVEVGGNDQLFNMLAGRDLILNKLHKEKIVLAGKLLSTEDGTKMGKSEGNMITLNDSANDIYGKVMAFTDNQIVIGFEILTSYEMEQVKEISDRLTNGENPIILKKLLAYEVTKDIKSEEEAQKAQQYFENAFQRKGSSERGIYTEGKDYDFPIKEINKENINIVDLIVECGITDSKTHARRLVEQGAVKIDENKISDWNQNISFNIEDKHILKCGRYVYQMIYIPKP